MEWAPPSGNTLGLTNTLVLHAACHSQGFVQMIARSALGAVVGVISHESAKIHE
jgi:hypothetical protein